MVALTGKNIFYGSLALSSAFCLGFSIAITMSETSQNAIDIIEQSRSNYVERFITSIVLDTVIQNGLTPKERKEIVDLGYKLWREKGDFPYDIFREKVYKEYGSSKITLQHQ